MLLYRILCFLGGLVLATLGCVFLIITFSLFAMGASINEYFHYISCQYQLFIFPFGIFMMILSLFFDNMWEYFSKIKEARRRRVRALKRGKRAR